MSTEINIDGPVSDGVPIPVTEKEVNLELNWTADARTPLSIERQANLMGFESAEAYLHQILAAAIAANEKDTIITKDGRLLSGSLADSYRDDDVPRNV